MFYQQAPTQGGFLNRFFRFLFANDSLSRLILINASFLLLVGINDLYVFLYQLPDIWPGGLPAIVYFSALPANLEQLTARPWTPITSMFVHQGFFHFFFNMLMLYFSGLIFKSLLRNRNLWITYLAGGLAGALVFVAAYNIFPVFAPVLPISFAIGASAAVMAVLFASVAYAPDYSIRLFLFGNIQLKFMALAFVLIDLLSISTQNPGGHIAHLGGALFGLTYGFLLRRKFRFKLNPMRIRKRKPSMKSKPNTGFKPETDDQYRVRRANEQKSIDFILDKISKGGYDSLTKSEKEFLFKHGK